MPLVRILVDGYSLLHSWPAIAPGKPRYSAGARAELVHWLRQYADATGTPVTVVFDGARPTLGAREEPESTREMEIIYSNAGQTADDIIERVTARLAAYGEVLVISNDIAERDTVVSFGGSCCSCDHFIRMVESSLSDFDKQVARYNSREIKRYKDR